MKKEEIKRLLTELNTLEELLELKKCKQSNSLPFVLVFKLHMQNLPIYKIAHRTKIPPERVSEIIAGGLTIPRSKIKKVKNLGYTICYCCKCRIVPLNVSNNVKLTRLCWFCYKRGSDLDSGTCPNKLHIGGEEVI